MRLRSSPSAALLLPGLILAAVTFRGALAQAPAAPPAKESGSVLGALPRDATLVIHATHIRAALDKLKASPAAGIQDHPAVKSLIQKIRERLSAGAAEAQKELGFDPVDVLTSLDGEWVFGLGNLEPLAGPVGEGLSIGQAPDVRPEMVPFVVAASAGTAAPRVREAFGKLFAFAEKQGATRTTTDFKGAKITSIIEGGGPAPDEQSKDSDAGEKDAKGEKKAEKTSGIAPPQDGAADGDKDDAKDKDDEKEEAEAEAAPPRTAVHFGEKDGKFYVSPSRAFLEACLGGGDSVLTHAQFQESRGAVGTGDALIYLNVKQLTDSVGSALSSTFFAFFWQKINALVFGKSFNNLVLNIAFDPKGLRETYFIHNSGASDGILGVFKGEAFGPRPQAIVPADTKSYSTTALNPEALGRTIKDVAQTLMAFRGQGTDVDVFFESQLGAKLSEIVGGLGRRLSYYQGPAQPGQTVASNLCVLVEVRDDAPLQKVLKKLSTGPRAALEAGKHKDRELYTTSGSGLKLGFAVAEKNLYVGSADEVKRSLDQIGAAPAGLAESEGVKQIAASLPKEVTAFSYATPDYIKSSFSALAAAAKESADEDGALLIEALLALADYCGTSYGYAVWKDKGVYGDAWMLYKKP